MTARRFRAPAGRAGRRAVMAAAATAAAGALLLAGCASPAESFDDEASAALRARVVAVAERSSATDYPGAVAELDRLEQSLEASVAAGEVPAEREAGIREAITLVRTDLDALLAAATAPEPEPAPAPDPASTDDKGDKGKGKDDSGKGKGKGSGNDD